MERLTAADGFWLATTGADGRPHLVPVLGVWVDGAVHFAAGTTTRKWRNLARDQRCVLSTRHRELDLVLEGVATRVTDEPALRRVAEEYLAKYAWPVTIEDGAFQGEGAPTAGPPPYEVFRLVPSVAFAFSLDERFGPARWVFA